MPRAPSSAWIARSVRSGCAASRPSSHSRSPADQGPIPPPHRLGRRAPRLPLALRPLHNARNADLEQPRRLPATPPSFNRRHHPFAQIKRIGSRHPCWPPDPSQHLKSHFDAGGNPSRFRPQETRSRGACRCLASASAGAMPRAYVPAHRLMGYRSASPPRPTLAAVSNSLAAARAAAGVRHCGSVSDLEHASRGPSRRRSGPAAVAVKRCRWRCRRATPKRRRR